jgi:hypothetical protein
MKRLAHASALVAAALSVIVGGCDSNGQGQCNCPMEGPGIATIWLPCGSTGVTAQATGVCTASVAQGADRVDVQGTGGAGACTVQLDLGGGSTTAYQFQFTSAWVACGGDPHGCGQTGTASPAEVQLGSQCGSSGGGGGGDARGAD